MTTPPKRIVFHLGFQKTGTTTIQAMLNANLDLMPDIEVRAYGDATKSLRVSGRNFCADPTKQKRLALEQALSQQIETFVASKRNVCLISDENIIGRVAYNNDSHVLNWALTILPMIEHAATGLELEFVFYTRRPNKWLRSIYNQSVKRARVTQTFDNWRANVPFELDWSKWQQQLQASVSAPVHFVSMEDELKAHGCLGMQLLSLAGVADTTVQKFAIPAAQNLSLSPKQLAFMRFVNRMPLSDKRVIRISEWVEARGIRKVQG